MAAEIKTAFGLEAQLLEGARGIFDVIADGRLVYSKYQSGRFPEPGELVKILSPQ